MVNILHLALHKAAVCLVVWPTNPRPHKVRKKDCVWPKSQLLKATAKKWLEWSVFLRGPLQCAFVFLIPLVLCYLSSDDAFKCFLCGPQRFTSQQEGIFCYVSSTNDQWTGMWQHHKEPLFFSRSNTPVSSNFVLGCLANAPEWIQDSGAGLFVVVIGGQMQWDSFTIRTVALRRWAILTRDRCGSTRERKPNAWKKRSCSGGTGKRRGALEKHRQDGLRLDVRTPFQDDSQRGWVQ